MKTSSQLSQSVSFLKFWFFVTEQLGDSHGSIDPNLKTAQAFFSHFSDQQGLLKEIIIASYSLNKCRHLKDSIDVNLVLDLLGQKAFELKIMHADDLLDIELLEEIGWLISQHFAQFIDIPTLNNSTDKCDNTASPIISLPRAKIRRANRQL